MGGGGGGGGGGITSVFLGSCRFPCLKILKIIPFFFFFACKMASG